MPWTATVSPRARAAIAEGVVGRDAGARAAARLRRRPDSPECARRLRAHDHVLAYPAVVADAGDLFPLAVDEEALATGVAGRSSGRRASRRLPGRPSSTRSRWRRLSRPDRRSRGPERADTKCLDSAELHQRIAVTDPASSTWIRICPGAGPEARARPARMRHPASTPGRPSSSSAWLLLQRCAFDAASVQMRAARMSNAS